MPLPVFYVMEMQGFIADAAMRREAEAMRVIEEMDESKIDTELQLALTFHRRSGRRVWIWMSVMIKPSGSGS